MDYTRQGPFVDNAPPAITGARLNALEDGLVDAAAHHKRGTLAAMPAAAAANKNWIYWAYDTGERFISDGAAWQPLPVGTNALIDKSVTNAKLADAVNNVLPSANEKAGFYGIGGMQNFSPVGYNNYNTGGANNKYLLQSSQRSFWVDLNPGSVNVFETGLWLVNSVYGFQDDQNTTRCSLVMMTSSTGGEGLKGVIVLATGGYTRNVTTSHTAVNHDTANGALQITTSHGNTRTFFRSIRPDISGGAAAKGV